MGNDHGKIKKEAETLKSQENNEEIERIRSQLMRERSSKGMDFYPMFRLKESEVKLSYDSF